MAVILLTSLFLASVSGGVKFAASVAVKSHFSLELEGRNPGPHEYQASTIGYIFSLFLLLLFVVGF